MYINTSVYMKFSSLYLTLSEYTLVVVSSLQDPSHYTMLLLFGGCLSMVSLIILSVEMEKSWLLSRLINLHRFFLHLPTPNL